MTSALVFEGVRKRYRKRTALDGLDLSVPTGSLFGLVGSNGAGKTTSLLVATGIVLPDAGRIRVLGMDSFDPSTMRGRVALLPQDSDLPKHMAVREILRYYGRLQGIPAAAVSAEVDRVLAACRLSDRAESPVRTLSHGMRRRVHLAQALLGDPELVLLDEPLSGLDPREVANIRGILQAMKGTRTVVVSSHNLSELERLCDRVAFIERGRTVRHGDMETITERQAVLHYRVRGTLPLAALRTALPGAVLEATGAAEDGDSWRTLTCRFRVETWGAAAVNRTVLSRLLEAGVEILDVTRGAGLENVYLRQAENVCGAGRTNRPGGPGRR